MQKKSHNLTFPLLACAALLSPALADAVDFEAAPFIGYRFGGNFEDSTTGHSVNAKESIDFGLAFDVEYEPDRMVELFYSHQSTELKDTSPKVDLDIEYIQVGGVAEYTQDDYTPYLVGTIGVARFSPGGDLDEETRFAATLGGGVKWFINKNIALKFEGRGYISVFNSNTDVFCVSNGGAVCQFRVSGSAVWQLEAMMGVAIRF
ncbi:MAG TPA: outer membrane beta-barrel protein [Steroidobacteraceae bacterium]|jgi:opacity protein-like surface antigen|nr:outer membrane beta-barrel protein [Steroidobacteraceae bacterium]